MISSKVQNDPKLQTSIWTGRWRWETKDNFPKVPKNPQNVPYTPLLLLLPGCLRQGPFTRSIHLGRDDGAGQPRQYRAGIGHTQLNPQPQLLNSWTLIIMINIRITIMILIMLLIFLIFLMVELDQLDLTEGVLMLRTLSRRHFPSSP